MRWFIGILILANLAIFAWSSLQHDPDRTASSLVEPGVGNIRLLREVTPTASDMAAQDPVDAATEAAEVPAPVVMMPAESEVMADAPAEAEADEPPASEATDAIEAATEPEIATSSVTTDAQPVCGRLGYFTDAAAAQKAVELLLSRQVEASAGSDKESELSGYWVLIPEQQDRAAGKAKLAELTAAGVKDVWLFASGPMKNAISLGLFSTEKNARRRSAQVEKSGFETEIRPKTSEIERFWIDYVLPAAKVLPPLDMPDAERLQQQTRDCP